MNPINIRKFCSELQLASEFSNRDVYQLDSSFFTRDITDFGIAEVFLGKPGPAHAIHAKNCHLRNEKTNASIYLTAEPSNENRYFEIALKVFIYEQIMVLECYSSVCNITATLCVQDIASRFLYESEVLKKPFDSAKPNITSSVDIGKNSLCIMKCTR